MELKSEMPGKEGNNKDPDKASKPSRTYSGDLMYGS